MFFRDNIDIDLDIENENEILENIDIDIEPQFDIFPPLVRISKISASFSADTGIISWSKKFNYFSK